MKQLLIDCGNSRLKWALLRRAYRRGQRFSAQGVLEISRATALKAGLARLLRTLRADTQIIACNVAGEAVARALRLAARRAKLPPPIFVHSEAAVAGVRNGYHDPWRLGVDRWVALVGAHHEHPGRNLCLVSIGTAITIDLLASDGQHGGGCIVPGPLLMIQSLLSGTAGIRRRAGGLRASERFSHALSAGTAAEASRQGFFAGNTYEGLLAGARLACAAVVERALAEARARMGGRPTLVLGGGGADNVAPLLRVPYQRMDELLLRGLAVLALADE